MELGDIIAGTIVAALFGLYIVLDSKENKEFMEFQRRKKRREELDKERFWR